MMAEGDGKNNQWDTYRRVPSIIEDSSMLDQITSMRMNSTSSANTPMNENPPSGFLSPMSAENEPEKLVPKRTNSAMASGMMTYKMDANPRGLALIVNVENFDNDVLERRDGSPKDVENLHKLLRRLKFKVIIKSNPTRIELTKFLMEFANDEQHKKADMMILAILTHGQDGNVYMKDGMKIDTEYIYGQFNNLNCKYLIGKPKFFIIQACRGNETDVSINSSKLDDELNAASSRKRRPPTSNDTMEQSRPYNYQTNEIGRARPTWEDMIIAYSTIPGYASIRDHVEGTWFIQALCETFERHAHENMLIDLLMMTSQRLSEFSNEKNEKQTCNVELRHMYKRLYFNSDMSVASLASFTRSLSTPPASPATPIQHYPDSE